jgi:hypothetical protein
MRACTCGGDDFGPKEFRELNKKKKEKKKKKERKKKMNVPPKFLKFNLKYVNLKLHQPKISFLSPKIFSLWPCLAIKKKKISLPLFTYPKNNQFQNILTLYHINNFLLLFK